MPKKKSPYHVYRMYNTINKKGYIFASRAKMLKNQVKRMMLNNARRGWDGENYLEGRGPVEMVKDIARFDLEKLPTASTWKIEHLNGPYEDSETAEIAVRGYMREYGAEMLYNSEDYRVGGRKIAEVPVEKVRMGRVSVSTRLPDWPWEAERDGVSVSRGETPFPDARAYIGFARAAADYRGCHELRRIVRLPDVSSE